MSQLEIELKQLKAEIINMWNLVHSQVVKSNVAMVNFDKNLAREVVSREKRVNGLELKIDRDCENIFALLTPVAVDLRFVLAVLKINSNLERIGDIAEGVAKYILSADKPFNPELLRITETIAMYDEAINMLEDTLTAFEKEDTQLARSVFQKDEFLDKININATNATCQYLVQHPEDAYQALINLSVIRRLERVGDQSKNIAEETIFYVEAKVLKHGEAYSDKYGSMEVWKYEELMYFHILPYFHTSILSILTSVPHSSPGHPDSLETHLCIHQNKTHILSLCSERYPAMPAVTGIPQFGSFLLSTMAAVNTGLLLSVLTTIVSVPVLASSLSSLFGF